VKKPKNIRNIGIIGGNAQIAAFTAAMLSAAKMSSKHPIGFEPTLGADEMERGITIKSENKAEKVYEITRNTTMPIGEIPLTRAQRRANKRKKLKSK
jgi:hypothetical protein